VLKAQVEEWEARALLAEARTDVAEALADELKKAESERWIGG
jgi:hypothetical protein